MIITAVKVNRLLKAESMDPLKALTFDLDLFGVREIAQRHTTVIQSLATLLLFCAELMEVGHSVRLRDLIFRQLVEI